MEEAARRCFRVLLAEFAKHGQPTLPFLLGFSPIGWLESLCGLRECE
jgi:hypothetical protein